MYYAIDLKNIEDVLHVFNKKQERDSWVDSHYETRVSVDSKHAHRTLNFRGRALAHKNAYVPTSWRGARYWKCDETSEPGVSEWYDVVKRYC